MAEVALNSVLHYNCWLWFYLWEYENQCYSGAEFTVCFGRGERQNNKKGHQHNSFYSANKLYVRRVKWDETLFALIVEEGTFFISYTWRDCHLVLGVCFFLFLYTTTGFLLVTCLSPQLFISFYQNFVHAILKNEKKLYIYL